MKKTKIYREKRSQEEFPFEKIKFQVRRFSSLKLVSGFAKACMALL